MSSGQCSLTEHNLLPWLKHREDERRLEPHPAAPPEYTELGGWATRPFVVGLCWWKLHWGLRWYCGHCDEDKGSGGSEMWWTWCGRLQASRPRRHDTGWLSY